MCVFASVCLSVSLRLREDNGSGSAERFLLLLFHIMDVWVFICWYFFRPQLLIDQNESIG